MILHLLADIKFVEYTVDHFESVYPGNNRYFFLSKSLNFPPTILNHSKVETITQNMQSHFAQKNKLKQYKAIILHSLHPLFFKFVFNTPKTVNIVWIIFGTDFYHTFMSYRGTLLFPQTKKMDRFSWHNIKYHLKPYYRKLIGKETNFSYVKRCLKSINYCALSQRETYQRLLNTGFSNAKYLEFSYYSVEETIGQELLDKTVNDENIFIGNSACLYNNHLDAFETIKKIDLEDRKIIVPLSYGDRYVKKRVIKRGRKLFKHQFIPLVDFIPRERYNKILLSCSYVIMNHLRPQARGNIITALWLGAKVFLNSETIFYKDFSDKGILIYPLSSLEADGKKAFVKLNPNQVEHNRKILMHDIGRQAVLEQCKIMVNTIRDGR